MFGGQKRQVETVLGLRLAPAGLTRMGYGYILLYLGGPLMGVLAAMDVIGYLIARWVFNSCYGLFCYLP